MNKIKIFVPDYVKYISDWVDYEIPYGKCIIDKGVTGCGFTEFCLTNKDNIILCSPRRLLLQNKIDQHLNDTNILYLRNASEQIADYDSSEKDDRRKKPLSKATPQVDYTQIKEQFKNQIFQHSLHCKLSRQPIKFLVTYDSFKYIKEFLGNQINNYKIVIDEFQSVFTDSNFKVNTELEFSEYIQDCPNVCYLSATPMLEKYLDRLEDFKDLDMYEFIWTNYVEKAIVERKLVSSAFQSVKGVIEDFQKGNFPQIVDDDKNIFISHEAVIYFNSVTDILKMVNSCGLIPQNTDIICADTDKNRKKLKKIGFLISKPNTYDNRHLNKMFTFCTRTVYLGADFYSDNASSYVVSNPNREHLAVDIALDLPQIIGRQRLPENPWKNHCTLFYQLSKDLRSLDDINKILDNKILSTERLLSNFNNADQLTKGDLAVKYRDSANYTIDYVGISRVQNAPIFNKLVWVAETRFWEVTQQEYYDNINVRQAIESQGYEDKYIETNNPEIQYLADYISGYAGNFADKLKAYCEFCDTHNSEQKNILDYRIGNKKFSNYYTYFGTDGLGNYKFTESLLKQELSNIYTKAESLPAEIKKNFLVGEKYTKKYIKDELGRIYDSLGISSIPKASELEKYFNLKVINISENQKRVKGFLIISIK